MARRTAGFIYKEKAVTHGELKLLECAMYEHLRRMNGYFPLLTLSFTRARQLQYIHATDRIKLGSIHRRLLRDSDDL